MSHSLRAQASSNMWNPGQLYLHDCYRGFFYVLTLNAPNALNKKSNVGGTNISCQGFDMLRSFLHFG